MARQARQPRRPARIFTAALVLLSWLSPTAVQAAQLLPLVRSVGAGSDKAAALVAYYLKQSLAADERYELVDLGKALGNQDQERALRAFSQAEDLLRQGREAYDTLELDAAATHLSQALTRFEHYVAYVGDFKKLAEAQMLLGATHILRGEEKPGQKCLEQAVSIYPGIEPDPRIFNPNMRRLFVDTVERSHARAAGTLALSSTPSAAEVTIDGRFFGVTPLAIDSLPEGRHWVRIDSEGYRPWGKLLDIVGRSEASENAQLRPTARFDDFDDLAAQAAAQAGKVRAGDRVREGDPFVSLGQLAHADALLVGQVRLDGEKVRVRLVELDLAGKRPLRLAEHGFTYDSRPATYEKEVDQFWRAKFRSELQTAGKRRPETAPEEAEAGGLMHAGEARCLGGARCGTVKWVVVGVTGAIGVGLMAAGGIEWYRAKKTANEYGQQIQVSSAAASLAAAGKQQARLGDIFFGAGALITLTSAALLTWWDPTPDNEAFVSPSRERRAALPRGSLQLAPLPGGGFVGAQLTF